MKRGLIVGAVGVLALVLMLDTSAQGGKDKTPTVKEIMKTCMSGKPSLCAKVLGGKGDDAEKEKLFKMLSALADNKAPAGTDDKNWITLTTGIKDAVKSGDTAKVKAALNCKGCHSEYKGK